MIVDGFGKLTIAVGKLTYKDIVDSMKSIDGELNKLGIKTKLYLRRRLIITKRVIIKFVLMTHHYRYNKNIYGVKADGCFGFSDMETYNITHGKNKCKGYELMDYILERNKDDGKRENIS